MKQFILIMIAAFVFVSAAYAKDYEVTKKAGDFDVHVQIDKNPPVVGDNNITIEIKDAAGKHVVDASVKVYYTMPAMPGMPPMNYKTDAKLKGDEYTATMNLSMSGPWNIAIKIKKDGKTDTVKFNIDAH